MSSHDLNLLTAFDVLLAEGSVVGAARRLHLSPSAMSRTLTRLRAAVGDPILVRAGRRLVPTPRATALRERVRHLVEQAEALFRAEQPLDLASLDRSFTIRANEGFVEAVGAQLIAQVLTAAPGVRLRFSPKGDKDVTALRDGRIDVDIGTPIDGGPELLRQTLFRDRFVGVVRTDHPLLQQRPVTAERYAACDHLSVSRRGLAAGPIDSALAALGLARRVVAIVTSFPAALTLARNSDLVANVTDHVTLTHRDGLVRFDLPVSTPEIVIAQLWHPRTDADPAHRWLRSCLRQVCADLA